MHVTWSLKFVGFYFRDVYEFLFARRYVTCRRTSGRTRGCVCRDKGLPSSVNCNCGPEGKPCSNRKEMSSNAQAAVARLPSSAFDRHQAAAAKSREEIGVRNAAVTMFMIVRTMFINLKFLRELSTVDKFLCNWSQRCNSFIVFNQCFNRKQCMYAVLMLSSVVEVTL